MAFYSIMMILIVSILLISSSSKNVNQHFRSLIRHEKTHASESNNFVAAPCQLPETMESMENKAPFNHCDEVLDAGIDYATFSRSVGLEFSEYFQNRCRFKNPKINISIQDMCPTIYWADMVEQYQLSKFVTLVSSLIIILSFLKL
ncbi:hypothetical protein ISN44_As11g002350 [Arabidopsis suecica]|uniref:Uncharacterized protein n=1 Tax=Arabidopsis suecica TaxID=45249 RepID=A0A8T1Z6Y8_ARASU|nr:hypothetical protein ISN44_As11g002350 [Arabidopsis suecica]